MTTTKERLLKADRKLTKAEWDHVLWGEKLTRTPKKDPHGRTRKGKRFNFNK